MNVFLFLMRPSGAPVSESARAIYERRLPPGCPRYTWRTCVGAAALIAPDQGPTPVRCVTTERGLAVGVARLDDRETLAWVDADRGASDDVELAVRAIRTRGVAGVSRLYGDFALAVYDAVSRSLVAARDAFGVKALYYVTGPDLVAVSSAAAMLADGDRYDHEYLAEFLVNGYDAGNRTIFAGVRPVQPGSAWCWANGVARESVYWRAEDFEPRSRPHADDAAGFRELFARAVSQRVGSGDETWAQLSGGLDSSAVVCMTEHLRSEGRLSAGIAGTVTLVDTLGSGDERDFVRAVTDQCQLPNTEVVDYWCWRDDGAGLPLTDQPTTFYPFYAAHDRSCAVVREGGGRVLLSGYGSDHYLTGNEEFLGDWFVRGHPLAAARELARWAIVKRRSFWGLSYRHVLYPLMPRGLRVRWAPRGQRIPPWLAPGFGAKYVVRDRMAVTRRLDGPIGEKFASAVRYDMACMPCFIDRGPFEDDLEVRYPFLYRPLVEFGLQLPSTARAQPRAAKWLLRESLVGILPDPVRARRGKGAMGGRTVWSLSRERAVVAELLRNPLLSQLGCIDRDSLATAVRCATLGRGRHLNQLLAVLALETWLRVRSGRWTAQGTAWNASNALKSLS